MDAADNALLPDLSRLRHPPPATIGAPFDIFDTRVNGSGFQTGVYVYAVDAKGVAHFGFGRKVPPERRVPFHAKNRSKANAGAAGTAVKYHGKWVSLGGGSDSKSTNPLSGALIELHDEAFFAEYRNQILGVHDVYVPWKSNGKPNKELLRLLVADQADPNIKRYTFCFEMKFSDFIRLFPNVDDLDNLRGGQLMVTASHGEIDSCASFTVDQIIGYQRATVAKDGDNFFTGYTLRTLVGPVFSALRNHLQKLKKQKLVLYYAAATATIEQLIQKDKKPRTPSGKRDKMIYK